MVHRKRKSLKAEGGGWVETGSAREDMGTVEPPGTPGGARKCTDCGKHVSRLAQKGKQDLHGIQQLHL